MTKVAFELQPLPAEAKRSISELQPASLQNLIEPDLNFRFNTSWSKRGPSAMSTYSTLIKYLGTYVARDIHNAHKAAPQLQQNFTCSFFAYDS